MMIKLPRAINIANLPTRIERLERLSKELGGPNIYIKRDDQTGTEHSGNKVRKLEFAVAQALDRGCNLLITCGGIQSNHCRATAAVAAKLGMKSYLALRTDEEVSPDGNHFIDILLGADIKFVTREEYSNKIIDIMQEMKEEKEKEGYKPYIIPEGASFGIGNFGYYKAMQEIISQEKDMDIDFDAIVIPVGSGGTYSGLFLGSKILNRDVDIFGVNVCDDEEYFKNKIDKIMSDSLEYLDIELEYNKEEINIIDGYVGRGYALSRPQELSFIHKLAKVEGVILDPVYTGKAMYGLTEEIKKGRFKDYKNILFIHTGGLFGLFPKRGMF